MIISRRAAGSYVGTFPDKFLFSLKKLPVGGHLLLKKSLKSWKSLKIIANPIKIIAHPIKSMKVCGNQ